MLKIGLSYINAINLGDQIIYQSARYLVEKSLAENNITDYEIIPVDICLTDWFTGYVPVDEEEFLRQEAIRKAKEAKLVAKIHAASSEEEKQALVYGEWKECKVYADFMANQADKLQDIDLFIFAGGGLIKFHAQHYHHMINEITKVCEERHVPVFIMSVGVEGFNEEDARCRLLRNALNRSCVKYISVRDDLETMQKYVIRPDIKLELVADPAFWVKERFRLDAPEPEEKLIGLNGIRQAIWPAYMYDVEREYLHVVYHDLIMRLVEEGYRVEVFSNGVYGDRGFLERMIFEQPDLVALRDDKILTRYYPTNPRRLIRRIARYERFMGVRLHSTIVGSVIGVPNVNLVWCVKQVLFGQQTGTSDNFLLKDDFNADTIYNRLISAKPYVVDEAYKASVYDGINGQIKKFLGGQYNE